MENSDINYFFLQGIMNSGHKGSKDFVHKGLNFHPTSPRVFRGPVARWKVGGTAAREQEAKKEVLEGRVTQQGEPES